ncbi:MAG: hypothetical protein AAFX00_06580, partial [Pseudomonadota bacterium]
MTHGFVFPTASTLVTALCLAAVPAHADFSQDVAKVFASVPEGHPFATRGDGASRDEAFVQLQRDQVIAFARQTSDAGNLECTLITQRWRGSAEAAAYLDEGCDGQVDAIDVGDGARRGFTAAHQASLSTTYRDLFDRLAGFLVETAPLTETALPVRPRTVVAETAEHLRQATRLATVLNQGLATTDRSEVRVLGLETAPGQRFAWALDFEAAGQGTVFNC